jgi:transcriptional regulator with XRE-family HTH domain
MTVSGVGRRLRALRMAKGWSQAQLARISGVSRSTIAKLESGRQRSVEFVEGVALAKALGTISPDELMGVE